MSHHLDTPLAAQSGQLFIDDLYVFPGQASTVLVMNVNSDITGSRAEPGFHPEARYEFKIHSGWAEYEDLTYRIAFGEADANGGQALRLHSLTGDGAREDTASRRTPPGRPDRRNGRGRRYSDLGRAHRRLLLHRPLSALDR